MKALVSIIIPVYKVKEEYLRKCIESVINQTFKDIEIILIDDGSPDNCGAICDEYAQIDNRIKVIHKENGGVSSARNAGLDNAIGEYIMFVDADDWVDCSFAESMYNVAQTENVKIAVFGSRIYNMAGELVRQIENKPCVLDFNGYCENIITFNLAPWNKIYAKELFSEVRFEEGRDAEDVLILPKLITQCNRFFVSDKILYNYRVVETSFTHKKYTIKHLDIPRAFIYLSNFILDNKINNITSVINATAYKLLLSYNVKGLGKVFKRQRNKLKADFKTLTRRTKNSKVRFKYRLYWELVCLFPRLTCIIRKAK